MLLSVADTEQITLIPSSSTPIASQRDPSSRYPVHIFSGDEGFGNKSEISANDTNTALVNGAAGHDTNMSNDASHFQLAGSKSDNHNNSVQR